MPIDALTQPAIISEWRFFLHLVGSALLATVLAWFYVKYGRSLSNRRAFARNFILMAATTTLIITVVKSSLALSLGLVGALSIVRFRTAVKDPEELAYLFITIGIGLGFGADQSVITTIAVAVILAIIAIQYRVRFRERGQNLFLTLSSDNRGAVDVDKILSTLRDTCAGVELKRFDESGSRLEVCVMAEFDDFQQLQDAKRALRKLDDSLQISFMDQEGML